MIGKFVSIIALATGLAATAPQEAKAQEPTMGQLQLVGFNFCPRGWANADGQLLAISQNSALFSLFGTIYGGDGRTTFALPDLRGRVPIHAGNGPGLTPYREGQRGGAERHKMIIPEMPSHNHTMRANGEDAEAGTATGNVLATTTTATYSGEGADVSMNSASITNTGGGQSFGIIQPFLAMRWCVAMQGIYPSRS